MEKKKVISNMDKELEAAAKTVGTGSSLQMQDHHLLVAIALGLRYLVEKSE